MCWFVQQKGLNWQKCPDSDLLLHLCFCCLRPPQVHPGGPGPAHEVTGGSEGAGVASAQRPAGIGRWHHRIRDSPGGSQGGDMTSPAPPDKGLRIAPKHKPGPAPLPCLPRPVPPPRSTPPPCPHAPNPHPRLSRGAEDAILLRTSPMWAPVSSSPRAPPPHCDVIHVTGVRRWHHRAFLHPGTSFFVIPTYCPLRENLELISACVRLPAYSRGIPHDGCRLWALPSMHCRFPYIKTWRE